MMGLSYYLVKSPESVYCINKDVSFPINILNDFLLVLDSFIKKFIIFIILHQNAFNDH